MGRAAHRGLGRAGPAKLCFKSGRAENSTGRAGPSRLARYIVCFRIFLQQYLYFSLFFTHGNTMTCANNCSPCTCMVHASDVRTAIFEIWMEQMNQRTQVAATRECCPQLHIGRRDLARTTSLRRRHCHLLKPLLQSMLDVCMPLGCTRTVCAALTRNKEPVSPA